MSIVDLDVIGDTRSDDHAIVLAASKRDVHGIVKRIHETLITKCMYMNPPIECRISNAELRCIFDECCIDFVLENINNVLIRLGFGDSIEMLCKHVGSWDNLNVDSKIWIWRSDRLYSYRFANRAVVVVDDDDNDDAYYFGTLIV